MFHTLISAAVAAILLSPQVSPSVEIPFSSHDNQKMLGKLTVPDSNGRYPVVIYVQTAEGATVDQKRPNGHGGTFNYFDLYRERLPEMKFAFFSYGIHMGDSPPRYERIDWDAYNTSTLENKVDYFEGLDHSFGLGRYLAIGGELPEGHKAIFEYIRSLQ